MGAESSQERYCPSCGETTTRPFCPADGVATLERKRLDVAAMAIHEGDIIGGRYRVTGVLGKGGFGAVYSAEHTGTQQAVALKMLLAAGEASEDEVRRFHREAQVTAQLRHPNTVRVFDVGQTDAGALYLAMELLHGETLEAELKARAKRGEVLREDEAIEIGASILRSLSEAHGKGLVHRDLKPANIMLTDVDGEQIVKVLDFGIARQHDSSLTGEGRTLGTPAYMSPEQCRGAEVDGRSDLYSLGIILYRCVVGQPPFGDTNPMALIFKHTSEPPPDLRSAARTPVSEAFVGTVMRALAKPPADRFADARSMRDALLGVRSGTAPVHGTSSFRVGRRGGDTMDDIDLSEVDAYDATLDSGQLAAAAGPESTPARLRVGGEGTHGALPDVEHGETLSVTTSQRLAASPGTVTVGRTAAYVEPAAMPTVSTPPALEPGPLAEPTTSEPAATDVEPATEPTPPRGGRRGWIIAGVVAVVSLAAAVALWPERQDEPAAVEAQPIAVSAVLAPADAAGSAELDARGDAEVGADTEAGETTEAAEVAEAGAPADAGAAAAADTESSPEVESETADAAAKAEAAEAPTSAESEATEAPPKVTEPTPTKARRKPSRRKPTQAPRKEKVETYVPD